MTFQKIDICCPTCGEKETWKEENKARPFCCERCKLIDLGEWGNENRSIPGDDILPSEEDSL